MMVKFSFLWLFIWNIYYMYMYYVLWIVYWKGVVKSCHCPFLGYELHGSEWPTMSEWRRYILVCLCWQILRYFKTIYSSLVISCYISLAIMFSSLFAVRCIFSVNLKGRTTFVYFFIEFPAYNDLVVFHLVLAMFEFTWTLPFQVRPVHMLHLALISPSSLFAICHRRFRTNLCFVHVLNSRQV